MKKTAVRTLPTSINAFVCCVSMLGLSGYAIQASAEDPWPWSGEPGEDDVTLILLGDFNVQKRADPAEALDRVRGTLGQADLVYANLEGLLVESKGADKDLPNKSGWTHLGPDAVRALVAGNISAVGVANNVAYGRDNVMASLAVLDANGIAHTGAGRNIDAAHEPAIVERKGVTFGFLQYTSKWYDANEQIAAASTAGVARLASPDGRTLDRADLERMLNDIEALRPLVDVLVVSTHTRDGQGRGSSAGRGPADGRDSADGRGPADGRDPADGRGPAAGASAGIADDLYSRLPVNPNLEQFEPYQRELARAAIDAGADIVFGHGCHSLQAVETYRTKPVMHCLGNFASDWIRVRDYRDGLVARVVIADKKVKRVSLVPVTRDAETNNVRLLGPDSDEGRKLMNLSAPGALTIEGQELVLLDAR